MALTLDFEPQSDSVIRLRYLRECGYHLLEVRLWLRTERGELEPTDRCITLPPEHWEEVIFEFLTAVIGGHRKVA